MLRREERKQPSFQITHASCAMLYTILPQSGQRIGKIIPGEFRLFSRSLAAMKQSCPWIDRPDGVSLKRQAIRSSQRRQQNHGVAMRCHSFIRRRRRAPALPATLRRDADKWLNYMPCCCQNKTPAGGGSGGRIILTGNWEEECCQSIAARLGGGVRGCESRHEQSIRGLPENRAGAPSPSLER